MQKKKKEKRQKKETRKTENSSSQHRILIYKGVCVSTYKEMNCI